MRFVQQVFQKSAFWPIKQEAGLRVVDFRLWVLGSRPYDLGFGLSR